LAQSEISQEISVLHENCTKTLRVFEQTPAEAAEIKLDFSSNPWIWLVKKFFCPEILIQEISDFHTITQFMYQSQWNLMDS
ncbi:MAG: hypothetical protein ACE5HW_00075, partial [Candidatus Methanofastidiosia archaeon]